MRHPARARDAGESQFEQAPRTNRHLSKRAAQMSHLSAGGVAETRFSRLRANRPSRQLGFVGEKDPPLETLCSNRRFERSVCSKGRFECVARRVPFRDRNCAESHCFRMRLRRVPPFWREEQGDSARFPRWNLGNRGTRRSDGQALSAREAPDFLSRIFREAQSYVEVGGLPSACQVRRLSR